MFVVGSAESSGVTTEFVLLPSLALAREGLSALARHRHASATWGPGVAVRSDGAVAAVY